MNRPWGERSTATEAQGVSSVDEHKHRAATGPSHRHQSMPRGHRLNLGIVARGEEDDAPRPLVLQLLCMFQMSVVMLRREEEQEWDLGSVGVCYISP
jgi:hypothetical protein